MKKNAQNGESVKMKAKNSAFLHFLYNKNNSVSIGEHFAKGIDAYGDEEDQNCSDAGPASSNVETFKQLICAGGCGAVQLFTWGITANSLAPAGPEAGEGGTGGYAGRAARYQGAGSAPGPVSGGKAELVEGAKLYTYDGFSSGR